jgi:type IV secretion system protein VirB7
MMRILLPFLLTLILAGCSSISHPLPKCDGYSRRPLNRSMWQWENNEKSNPKTSEAVPAHRALDAAAYADEAEPALPAAFAQFDVDGSYRPCEGK